MSIRVIGTAMLAAAVTGVAGIASGIAFSAWILMALGAALTIVAASVALHLALRRHPPIMPAAATIEPGVNHGNHADHSPDHNGDRHHRAETSHAPSAAEAAAGRSDQEALVVLADAEPRHDTPEHEAKPLTQPHVAPAGVGPFEVLEAFLLSCQPAGHVLSAHLWLLDSATSTMRLVEAVGEARPGSEPLSATDSIIGRTAESGEAQLSSDVELSSGSSAQSVWRYAIPLDGGAAKGVAAVDVAADDPDAEFLAGISEHLRSALAAALAIHVSRTETASARALLEAVGEIVRLVDPQAIVESGLQRALELSDAQSGSIMLLESDGGMRIRAARGLPEHVVEDSVVWEGEGIAGVVLATGQSLVVEDLEGKGGRARRHGVRSAVAVPISDEEGLLGVLNVGSHRFHARFSSSHVQTLESLGRIVGMALRNAWALTSSRELYLDTVKALALALETKDPYSQGSTERVYQVATELGRELGLTRQQQQALKVAALLHDIGMAAAGDLSAAGCRPLTTVERGMLKMHPVIAADVLSQADALKDAVPIVYHHHEHYDGQGYVLGVAGHQIPIGARVLAVADSYVSMTSPRPYRAAMTHAEALEELRDKAGTQFDPEVVGTFLAHESAFVQARNA